MADRKREQLLGYLLGALEEAEQESIETELNRNPKLLRDLALVRESLSPLWVVQPEYDPPPGLAERTCRLVAAHPRTSIRPEQQRQQRIEQTMEEPAGKCSQQAGGDSKERRLWRMPLAAVPLDRAPASSHWLDVVTALGVVAALLLLVFPAIQTSRFNSRLARCTDHLRQIGLGMIQYSEAQGGFFPPVYIADRLPGAGLYATMLLSNGFVEGSHCFVCPDSPLADDPSFQVPTLDQLLTAPQEEWDRLRSRLGGSFGSSLGFVEHGRYHSPRNFHRTFAPVISDAPSADRPGHQTINHAGRMQNVLHEDGHVDRYATSRPNDRADDIFENALGDVDAGTNRNDAVIGPSGAAPRLLQIVFGTN